MTTTYAIRAASKEYRCTEASWHTIRPGDLYLYEACPPWHEMARGKKWCIIRACLRCAREYGMLTKEAEKQIHERQANFAGLTLS